MAELLIGREHELAELHAGLRDAIEGRGSLVLVAGEPGIGKTALAERLARALAPPECLVLRSHSWEGGSPASYWAWVQIVRQLLAAMDDEMVRTLLRGEFAPHIALIAPELRPRLGGDVWSLPRSGSDAARFYLFEAVTGLLKSVSGLRPLVLVLDDVLTGDRPSVELLRFLVGDLRASRMLVVVTFRDSDARSLEVRDALGDLVRQGHTIRLGGLGIGEAGQLVTSLSATAPSMERVAAIHESTRGNPLFIREVTSLLEAESELDASGRIAIAVPDTIRAVIRRRQSRLSADAVQVLSAAAAIRREFDPTLVSHVTALPVERVLAALTEAVELDMATERSAGVYDFAHPLTRDAIYEDLPARARAQLHREVGQSLEQVHRSDVQSDLGELAYHFSRVGTADAAAIALQYARSAGDRAMESSGYEEAALQYGRALEAARIVGADEAVRCDLLLSLGSSQARSGAYPESKTTFLHAADLARRLGSPDRLARAALGFGEPQVEGGLVDRELLALLREARTALPPEDNALRARVLARTSLELTFADDVEHRDNLRDALSREAMEIARRIGDPGTLAAAYRARWMAVWGPDGIEERSALSDELVNVAWETSDRELELVGRARRITCSLEAGDLTGADTDIAAHRQIAEGLRMPFHRWIAASLQAGRTLLDGSLDLAERQADQASSLLAESMMASQARLNQMTAIRWDQGRLGELRGAWAELVERFPQAGYVRGLLSLAEASRGHNDEASRGLRTLIGQLGDLPRNGVWLPALAAASLTASHVGARDAAATVYRMLEPYAGLLVVIPMPHPVVCFGSVRLYLGLLASTSSAWEESEQHFDAAAEIHDRIGARALLARTRYEWARMLIDHGRSADRRRAVALLDSAEQAAMTIGMTAIVDGCVRLREIVAGRAVSAGAADVVALPRNTFRREGDYWTVVYEGSLVRLRDSKGLRLLARLMREPGREFHALDLELATGQDARSSRSAAAEGLEARGDLGHAGAILDARAKIEYRSRLEELRSELEEAETYNDPSRAAKAEEEIDFITGELANAVGLGGRNRLAASAAERARLNVTRAIRSAVSNLARANPALGRHLAATIRTGRYCSYTPDPRADVAWES